MPLVLVAGALANKPGNGGEAWVRISWVLGLRRLGFEVHLVEEISSGDCVDKGGGATSPSLSVNARFFREVTEAMGLGSEATLVCRETRETIGLSWSDLAARAASADALVNLSGNLREASLVGAPGMRIYVDLDPVYTQAWHAAGALDGALRRHDHHYTVGQNVRALGPRRDGIDWRPIAPPVLLEHWPVAPGEGEGAFTTVASWRGAFGSLELDGRTLGRKAHEFRRVMDLPGRVAWPLEIALDIHPADRGDLDALRAAGWRIVDPRGVAATPGAFRDYVRGSSAEFSVAQGAYVETRSGWLSDRTAHYLASGRPALIQDTGAALGSGEGLVTFSSVEEAVAGAARIAGDYAAHREAARALAERHLDSDVVLARFAEEVGLAP